MKKLLTFLLTALLAFGISSADEVTYTMTMDQNANGNNNVHWTSQNQTLTWDNVSWSTSSNGTPTSGSKSHVQIGTASNPATYVTISTDDIPGTITDVTVNVWTASNSNAVLSISVGGTYYITNKSLSTTSTNYHGSGTSSGEIIISMTQTTAKALYISSISVTYDDNGTTPSEPKYYHKVTSPDEIVEGKKYLIVYEQGQQFLGRIAQNSTNRYYGIGVDGPTISGNQVDINGYNDIRELTLSSIDNYGRFALHNGDGYLCYYAADGSNPLNVQSTVSTASKWGYVEQNGGYIVRSASSASRYIQYDSNIDGFACYLSSMENAYLYVEGEAPVLEPCAEPEFTPNGGVFIGSVNVTITSATEGATIYYTTDDSEPTTSSNSIANGGTVTINTSCTLKAIAVAQGHGNSTVAEATYTKEAVPMPTFSPVGGTFDIGQSIQVSISAIDGATIYYTVDGNNPEASRMAYTGPITISETTTLKAIAVYNGESSEVNTAHYNFLAPGTSCSVTISFTSRGDESTNISNSLMDYVATGSDVITSISGTNVYSSTNKGIRLGSSGNPGSMTFNLVIPNPDAKADEWRVSKIEVTAAQYGSDEASLKVTTSADATGATHAVSGSDMTDYTFSLDRSDITSFTVATTTKRAYIESVTIYYECTPVATLTAEPNPLNINDNNEAGGKTGTFAVTGENLGSDPGVGVTLKYGNFTRTTDGGQDGDWGFANTNGTINGNVTVTYQGHALSSKGQIRVANNLTETLVDVNYLYVGPIYVVGDVNETYWNTNNGAQLNRDENGLYTGTVTVQQSDGTAGYIAFTKQLGSDYSNGQFGPISSGNWWLAGNEGVYQPIDTLGNKNNIRLVPGVYTVNVNPATNEFMITPYVINITFSPEDGTHFTGATISGTITDTPAGTLEWSTDGINWQTYSDGFTANVAQPNQSVTIYARSTSNGVTATAQATYTRDLAPAPEAPNFSMGGGDVLSGTVITITAPEGCTLYVDGQQVTSPYNVTITQETTISAYCVNDEGTQSTTVINTYFIATVCEATIVFKGSGGVSDSNSNIANNDDNSIPSGLVESGSGYINSSSTAGAVYNGKGSYGLKLGSNSSPGSFTINLAPQPKGWKVSRIIVNALGWSANAGGELHVTTSADADGSTTTLTYGDGNLSDFANYEFSFNGSDITSFTVSTTNDHKRCYVKSVTLVYSCTPILVAPTISPQGGDYVNVSELHVSIIPSESNPEGTQTYYWFNSTGDDIPENRYLLEEGQDIVLNGSSWVYTASCIEVNGETYWSTVTQEYYTLWPLYAPIINPSELTLAQGNSEDVTIQHNPENNPYYNGNALIDVETLYTTDGSDPRTSESAESFTKVAYSIDDPLYPGENPSVVINVSEDMTIRAISKIVMNGETYWSEEAVGHYYFIESLPLVDLIANGEDNHLYILDDYLIGAWAVNNGDMKFLWAKDDNVYNNESNGFAEQFEDQKDYVKDILKYHKKPAQGEFEWDNSNWILLDFSQLETDPSIPESVDNADPENYVGHANSYRIVGTYVHGEESKNYRFIVKEISRSDNDEDDIVEGYPGWDGAFPENKLGVNYDLDYNSYVPVNFLDYWNHIELDGEGNEAYYGGFVAGEDTYSLPQVQGDHLYFLNPKFMEVAHIWGVWWPGNEALGTPDYITVYEASVEPDFISDGAGGEIPNPNAGKGINAWGLPGAVELKWDFNRLAENIYGRPIDLSSGVAYEFHAAIVDKNDPYPFITTSSGMKRATPVAQGQPVNPADTEISDSFILYPLDMDLDGTWTAVKEISALNKSVVSVSYYNPMGMESKTPFEGINIVVTRYNDGSSSTVKVLK